MREIKTETLEAMAVCNINPEHTDGCARKREEFPSKKELAIALLETRYSNKTVNDVWDGANDQATTATVNHSAGGCILSHKCYTRELPKSRARIIAERRAKERWNDGQTLEDTIEAAILEALK